MMANGLTWLGLLLVSVSLFFSEGVFSFLSFATTNKDYANINNMRGLKQPLLAEGHDAADDHHRDR